MAESTVQLKRAGIAELQQELVAFWRALPNKGFFLVLLACWIALFQWLGNSTFGYIDTASLFRWMYNSYTSAESEDGHGVLIPFVVLVLFWWKRDSLLALPKSLWWPGLLGLAGASLLHLLGYLVQQPRISIIAFFVGAFALMGLTWGKHWLKASFFPYVLFAFCVPIGALAGGITFKMRVLATQITVGFCHAVLGINVIRDGVRIYEPNGAYTYEVAAACSGIRSSIALLALTTIYGFVTFTTWWKRLLFVVLAIPLAILGNVVRLTGIVFAAEAFGQGAGQFVHEWFGFITFAIAIGCIMMLGYWLRDADPSSALEKSA